MENINNPKDQSLIKQFLQETPQMIYFNNNRNQDTNKQISILNKTINEKLDLILQHFSDYVIYQKNKSNETQEIDLNNKAENKFNQKNNQFQLTDLINKQYLKLDSIDKSIEKILNILSVNFSKQQENIVLIQKITPSEKSYYPFPIAVESNKEIIKPENRVLKFLKDDISKGLNNLGVLDFTKIPDLYNQKEEINSFNIGGYTKEPQKEYGKILKNIKPENRVLKFLKDDISKGLNNLGVLDFTKIPDLYRQNLGNKMEDSDIAYTNLQTYINKYNEQKKQNNVIMQNDIQRNIKKYSGFPDDIIYEKLQHGYITTEIKKTYNKLNSNSEFNKFPKYTPIRDKIIQAQTGGGFNTEIAIENFLAPLQYNINKNLLENEIFTASKLNKKFNKNGFDDQDTLSNFQNVILPSTYDDIANQILNPQKLLKHTPYATKFNIIKNRLNSVTDFDIILNEILKPKLSLRQSAFNDNLKNIENKYRLDFNKSFESYDVYKNKEDLIKSAFDISNNIKIEEKSKKEAYDKFIIQSIADNTLTKDKIKKYVSINKLEYQLPPKFMQGGKIPDNIKKIDDNIKNAYIIPEFIVNDKNLQSLLPKGEKTFTEDEYNSIIPEERKAYDGENGVLYGNNDVILHKNELVVDTEKNKDKIEIIEQIRKETLGLTEQLDTPKIKPIISKSDGGSVSDINISKDIRNTDIAKDTKELFGNDFNLTFDSPLSQPTITDAQVGTTSNTIPIPQTDKFGDFVTYKGNSILDLSSLLRAIGQAGITGLSLASFFGGGIGIGGGGGQQQAASTQLAGMSISMPAVQAIQQTLGLSAAQIGNIIKEANTKDHDYSKTYNVTPSEATISNTQVDTTFDQIPIPPWLFNKQLIEGKTNIPDNTIKLNTNISKDTKEIFGNDFNLTFDSPLTQNIDTEEITELKIPQNTGHKPLPLDSLVPTKPTKELSFSKYSDYNKPFILPTTLADTFTEEVERDKPLPLDSLVPTKPIKELSFSKLAPIYPLDDIEIKRNMIFPLGLPSGLPSIPSIPSNLIKPVTGIGIASTVLPTIAKLTNIGNTINNLGNLGNNINSGIGNQNTLKNNYDNYEDSVSAQAEKSSAVVPLPIFNNKNIQEQKPTITHKTSDNIIQLLKYILFETENITSLSTSLNTAAQNLLKQNNEKTIYLHQLLAPMYVKVSEISNSLTNIKEILKVDQLNKIQEAMSIDNENNGIALPAYDDQSIVNTSNRIMPVIIPSILNFLKGQALPLLGGVLLQVQAYFGLGWLFDKSRDLMQTEDNKKEKEQEVANKITPETTSTEQLKEVIDKNKTGMFTEQVGTKGGYQTEEDYLKQKEQLNTNNIYSYNPNKTNLEYNGLKTDQNVPHIPLFSEFQTSTNQLTKEQTVNAEFYQESILKYLNDVGQFDDNSNYSNEFKEKFQKIKNKTAYNQLDNDQKINMFALMKYLLGSDSDEKLQKDIKRINKGVENPNKNYQSGGNYLGDVNTGQTQITPEILNTLIYDSTIQNNYNNGLLKYRMFQDSKNIAGGQFDTKSNFEQLLANYNPEKQSGVYKAYAYDRLGIQPNTLEYDLNDILFIGPNNKIYHSKKTELQKLYDEIISKSDSDSLSTISSEILNYILKNEGIKLLDTSSISSVKNQIGSLAENELANISSKSDFNLTDLNNLTKDKMFKEGGYTSGTDTDKVQGVVHEGEYVIPKNILSQNTILTETLENIRTNKIENILSDSNISNVLNKKINVQISNFEQIKDIIINSNKIYERKIEEDKEIIKLLEPNFNSNSNIEDINNNNGKNSSFIASNSMSELNQQINKTSFIDAVNDYSLEMKKSNGILEKIFEILQKYLPEVSTKEIKQIAGNILNSIETEKDEKELLDYIIEKTNNVTNTNNKTNISLGFINGGNSKQYLTNTDSTNNLFTKSFHTNQSRIKI